MDMEVYVRRVGVEPTEFTSVGGGGIALPRRVKGSFAAFYEIIRFVMQRIFIGLLPWQHLLLAYCAGLLASHYPGPALFGFAVFCGVAGHDKKAGYCMQVLAFVCGLGLGCLLLSVRSQEQTCPDHGQKVYVSGRIEQVTPLWSKRLRMVVGKARVVNGRKGGTALGKVLLTWQDAARMLFPGQEIMVLVRLRPIRGYRNPGAFERRFYWARQGVCRQGYLKGQKAVVLVRGQGSLLARIREQIRTRVMELLPPGPGQGLVFALLFGDRSQLSYPSRELLQRAGLAHLLALSGLHLGLVLSLGWGLAWVLGRVWPVVYLYFPRPKLAVLFMFPLAVSYLYLGNFRPSLVRAFLMFMFWGIFYWQGRKNFFLDGLFFALAVIVLCDPLAVFDLGLELSFVAVAGIITGQPVMRSLAELAGRAGGKSGRIMSYLAALLGCSVLAFVFLLPLLQLVFGQISVHLYWNLLWVPVLGFLVLPVGFFALVLAQIPLCCALAGYVLRFLDHVLSLLYDMLLFMDQHGFLRPFVCERPHWLTCLGFWLTVFLGLYLFQTTRQVRDRSCLAGSALHVLPFVLIALILLLSYPVYRSLRGIAGPQLSVIDVGQGQALLVTDLQGRRYLVDGGGSWLREYDLGRLVLAPTLTWHAPPRISKVILTHPDFDHLRGLFYILDNFTLGEFVFNGDWPRGADGQRLHSVLKRRRIPVSIRHKGERIALGDGLCLEVLHPARGEICTKKNNCSLVLRLTCNGRGLALLPGDIERPALYALLKGECRNLLGADVLVLPHHASRSSCLEAFYRAVHPRFALASLGANNPFHFPHQEVLHMLNKLHIPLLTTARHGQIRVYWNMGNGTCQLQHIAFAD